MPQIAYTYEILVDRYLVGSDSIDADPIWSKIEKTNVDWLGSCWIWKGSLWSGLPCYYYNGTRSRALAYILRLYRFPVIPGTFKAKCGNKLCVNPKHMWNSVLSAACFRGHIKRENTVRVDKEGFRACKLCIKLNRRKHNAKRRSAKCSSLGT